MFDGKHPVSRSLFAWYNIVFCICKHFFTKAVNLSQGSSPSTGDDYVGRKILKTTNVQQVRFMARSAASYILMLDEQSSQAQNVLHKNALPDDAAPVFISLRRGKPFHSAMKHCSVTLHNMKHSAYAPYDLSSIALRATDDEKRKMRVVFANIPCLCYIIQWKGKISWKKLQINSLIFLLALKEANETSYWLLLLGKNKYPLFCRI